MVVVRNKNKLSSLCLLMSVLWFYSLCLLWEAIAVALQVKEYWIQEFTTDDFIASPQMTD